MTIRDQIKDIKHFDKMMTELEFVLGSSAKKLLLNQVIESRISSVQYAVFDYAYSICFVKYSRGDDLEDVKSAYLNALNHIKIAWQPEVTIFKSNKVHDRKYYAHIHGTMLRMLSLGVLLSVSNEKFQILVDLIDRDKISDKLYEFLINGFGANRLERSEDVYTKKAITPEKCKDLEILIENTSSEKADVLIKKYLTKGFHYSGCGFYNTHKGLAYIGYWSFEAAAITCLMEIDDKLYKEQKYYPKDIADYYRNKNLN